MPRRWRNLGVTAPRATPSGPVVSGRRGTASTRGQTKSGRERATSHARGQLQNAIYSATRPIMEFGSVSTYAAGQVLVMPGAGHDQAGPFLYAVTPRGLRRLDLS